MSETGQEISVLDTLELDEVESWILQQLRAGAEGIIPGMTAEEWQLRLTRLEKLGSERIQQVLEDVASVTLSTGGFILANVDQAMLKVAEPGKISENITP